MLAPDGDGRTRRGRAELRGLSLDRRRGDGPPAGRILAPMETTQNRSAIVLTERAAAKVRDLMAQQGSPEGAGLRVKVVGGGCSGMSYQLNLEPAPAAA